jgi:hypothetical protein
LAAARTLVVHYEGEKNLMLIAVLKALPVMTLRRIPSTPPWRLCDFVGRVPPERVGTVADIYLLSSGVMAHMRTKKLSGKFTELFFDKLSNDGEDLMATGKYLRALAIAKRILYRSEREPTPQDRPNSPDPDAPMVIDLTDTGPAKKMKSCSKYPSKNPFVQIERLPDIKERN